MNIVYQVTINEMGTKWLSRIRYPPRVEKNILALFSSSWRISASQNYFQSDITAQMHINKIIKNRIMRMRAIYFSKYFSTVVLLNFLFWVFMITLVCFPTKTTNPIIQVVFWIEALPGMKYFKSIILESF